MMRWLVVGLVLIAAASRWIGLDQAPPGFWYDEGLNGLFARDVLSGDLRLFYGDREGLFFYLLAAVEWLTGGGVFPLRWFAASAGVVTVAALFAVGRRMLSEGAGVIAAALYVTTFWALAVNRFAERINLLPLFELLTVYWLWRAIAPKPSENRNFAIGVSGILLGLTLYTYLASRFFPIVLVVFVATRFLFNRRWVLSRSKVWLGVAGIAAAVFLPLGIHYLRFPDDFIVRTSQVSAFSGVPLSGIPSALGKAFTEAFGMFYIWGDSNWRHNVAGRPGFDMIAAAGLSFGIARSVLRWRRELTWFLLCWFIVMMLPSMLAADNPHFLRAFGAFPAALLIAAYGIIWLSAQLAGMGLGRRLVVPAIAAWLIWLGFTTGSTYIRDWRTSPEVLAAFEAETIEAANYLNSLPVSAPVVAAAQFRPHPAVEYLLKAPHQIRWIGGREGLVVLSEAATYLLLGDAEAAEAALSKVTLPVVSASGRLKVYGPIRPQLAPAVARSVEFGDILTLTGLDIDASRDTTDLPVIRPGLVIPIRLYTEVEAPPGRPDLAFFAQVRSGGNVLSQEDASPLVSDQWQTGQTLVTALDLTAPRQPGVYDIGVGLYGRDGGRYQATESGRNVGDAPGVLRVKISEGMPADPNSVVARFSNGVVLHQATFEPEACGQAVCPGVIRLRWSTITPLSEDLSVFVHLALPDGMPVYQVDGVPGSGRLPTTAWAVGERVDDERRIEAPAEGLSLRVGLYRANGERIPVGRSDYVKVSLD